MRLQHSLAAVAACAAAASAQTPRPSFNLDQGGTAIFDPMIATHGDQSVALYSAGDSTLGLAHVVAQRSDGRGLSWTTPAVQVDADALGARKDIDDPCYVQFGSGTNVYVVWEDLRSGNTEPYFASSNDGGATWNTEIPLPFGFASGAGAVRTDLRMAVAPGSPDKVYVAFASDSLAGPDTLFLVSSLDGGASFGPAVPVNGTADVDFLDIRASGSTVHIAFDDERVTAGIDDVYYNRSSDGGATLDFGTGVVIDGAGGVGNNQDRINVTRDGATVAVGWAAEETGLDEEYRVVVSTDGGTTFGVPVKVGGYAAGTDDVDEPRLMTSGGNLIATWEDDRLGSDNVFVATSTDGGATWAEQPSLGAGGFPRVSNTGSGDEHGVAITWTGGALPEDALAITSIDHGLTFSAAFPVNDTTGDADFAEIKWNDLYNNFVAVWMSDDIGATNHAYVGGFRPQTLTANGWVAGSTVVSFSFARFDPAGNVAWALVNLSGPGTLILADGRNLGLAADPLLSTSVQLAVLGVASSAISGAGSGATPPVPITLPPGLALWAVGAGIDTTAGAVVDITDVQKIQL